MPRPSAEGLPPRQASRPGTEGLPPRHTSHPGTGTSRPVPRSPIEAGSAPRATIEAAFRRSPDGAARPSPGPLPPRQATPPPAENGSGFQAFTDSGYHRAPAPRLSQQQPGSQPRRAGDTGTQTTFDSTSQERTTFTRPGAPDRPAGRRRAAEATGGHRSAAESGETTGTAPGETTQMWSRFTGNQTATGHHRAVGKAAGRRRIAKWPIVAGAFVVLLVVGLLGWGWANNVLNSRAEAQAAGCAEGDATMKVLVAPAVEKPVTAAATRWNQARTVVHSHCVHIEVRSMDSQRALDALTGRSNLDSIGGLPAAWIADNQASIDQLQAAKPGMIASSAEPVATTPSATYFFVGLTAGELDETQARAAQVFRDYLNQPAQRADFTAAGLTQG